MLPNLSFSSVQSAQESDLATFTWIFDSNCENFSVIKPPLFNENWCDFLGAACMYSKQNIKIITHIPIFKWLSGQSRNRSIRGLWDCHNVWEPLRRGHQGPLERWWHHGMLWQTERISAYRFCQIVSVHFIIFSFLPRRHGELQTREQGNTSITLSGTGQDIFIPLPLLDQMLSTDFFFNLFWGWKLSSPF